MYKNTDFPVGGGFLKEGIEDKKRRGE